MVIYTLIGVKLHLYCYIKIWSQNWVNNGLMGPAKRISNWIRHDVSLKGQGMHAQNLSTNGAWVEAQINPQSSETQDLISRNLQGKKVELNRENNRKWSRGVELFYLSLNGWFPMLQAPIMAEKGFWLIILVENYKKRNRYSWKMIVKSHIQWLYKKNPLRIVKNGAF